MTLLTVYWILVCSLTVDYPYYLGLGFDLPRLLAVTQPLVLDYAGTALTLGLNHAGTLLTVDMPTVHALLHLSLYHHA